MTVNKKFIFIIQGEGRGHLTQAELAKQIIEQNGHQLKMAFFGTSPQRKIPENVKEIFKDKVQFFRSPNFIRKKNRKGINLSSSIFLNSFRLFQFLNSIYFLRNKINRLEPDIVINFYDMLGGLAYYFSNRKSEFFAVSHHFTFESSWFLKPENFFLQKKLFIFHNHLCSLKACFRIALSFDKHPGFGRTKIIPPLIREDIRKNQISAGREVTVYLLNEGLSVDLLDIFWQNKDIQFNIFMDPGISTEIFPSNVRVNEKNNRIFAEKLLNCKALISTSGFESVCEAAFLGKPVFLIPSENHYEQHSNLRDAIRAGLALPYDSFRVENLKTNANDEFKSWCNEADSLFLQLFLT